MIFFFVVVVMEGSEDPENGLRRWRFEIYYGHKQRVAAVPLFNPQLLDLLPLPLPLPKRPFLLIRSHLIHHNHLLEPLPPRFGVRTDQTIVPSHLRLLILDNHVRTLAADGVFVTEDENGLVSVEEAVDVFGSAIGDRGAAWDV